MELRESLISLEFEGHTLTRSSRTGSMDNEADVYYFIEIGGWGDKISLLFESLFVDIFSLESKRISAEHIESVRSLIFLSSKWSFMLKLYRMLGS